MRAERKMPFTFGLRLLAIAAALALASVSVPLAHAGQLTGKYVQYEFSLTSASGSASGDFRQEVVADFENGTVRVRSSANVGTTSLTLERDTPLSDPIFPYLSLPPASPMSSSTILDDAQLELTLEPAGSEPITFSGSQVEVGLTRFSLSLAGAHKGVPTEISVSGTVGTFPSGLLYSITASVDVATGDVIWRSSVVVRLISTNLDPNVKPAQLVQLDVGASLLRGGLQQPLPAIAELGRIISPGGPEKATGTSPEPSPNPNLILLASVPAVVGILLALLLRRKAPPPEVRRERPLHWVHAARP